MRIDPIVVILKGPVCEASGATFECAAALSLTVVRVHLPGHHVVEAVVDRLNWILVLLPSSKDRMLVHTAEVEFAHGLIEQDALHPADAGGFATVAGILQGYRPIATGRRSKPALFPQLSFSVSKWILTCVNVGMSLVVASTTSQLVVFRVPPEVLNWQCEAV